MLKIELDVDKPGVSERSHEILSQVTEQIVTALELGQTKGEIISNVGETDVEVGTWVWE